MQFDADTVGAPDPAADAEMCMMMADTMEALGLEGQYLVRVNSRELLDAVMGEIGLNDEGIEGWRLDVMRAIDKLDRLKAEGVRELLGPGRLDASGDWKKGLELTDEQIDFLLGFLHCNIEADSDGSGSSTVRIHSNPKFPFTAPNYEPGSAFWAGIEELGAVQRMVRSAGYDQNRVAIDPSCVRGLEYYTGAVYECELTFPVTNEKGEAVQFGSVAGGGRYDGLVKRFTGQDVPATGFSIGVSRLMTALKNLGKLEEHALPGPVLVTVMDRDTEALAAYQQMVQSVRNADIRAEMYQGNPKQFGKQLQYADRRGSPIAIIQGSDERERGVVQIKDLAEGARLAEEITDNEEWRASRPAQREVAVEDLVAEVRKTLDAQQIG